ELLYLLKQAVKTLPTECRRIFELSYNEEKSSVEIASLLDISPATVRSQKRRAIQLIKEWIGKNGPVAGLVIGFLTPGFHFLQKFLLFICTFRYPHL
ncbi:MAG: sigma-70 family RNA polymerase sigma factor, partial [Bacteroidetes bacterium]|nr:sigma-70 family RNA polymerase sigma factor [Bacteroidota bacterium]